MTRERTREREEPIERQRGENILFKDLSASDRERVRKTVMDRYNAGESIIQPPSGDAKSLGEAIRDELNAME